MRLSRILLLVVALAAGGLAAFLVMTSGSSQPAPATTTEVVEEARAQILVAKTAIGMGERLSDQNIEWQDWPANAVRPEYVTIAATPQAITDMKGSVARFEFFPGEPIRQQKLVRTDQGYLSAVLDKGMRGLSISVTADTASGGFIVPNDHVDVILTQTTPQGQTSSTVLTNVRVLAINTRLGETGATGAPADPNSPTAEVFSGNAIATLELTPGQGETLVNASHLGQLSLALRSIVDFNSPEPVVASARPNSSIKVIRYGEETSITAGQAQTQLADAGPVDPAPLAQAPVSIGVTPAPTDPIAVTPAPLAPALPPKTPQ